MILPNKSVPDGPRPPDRERLPSRFVNKPPVNKMLVLDAATILNVRKQLKQRGSK